MKRTALLAIALTLTFLVMLAAPADAHGRGATAFPFSTSSDSGLKLSGVVTCSTVTAYATHPDGQHALLAVWVDGDLAECIEDRESSMMSWDDVRPGSTVRVYLAGQEDGDSLRLQLFTPKCGPVR